MSSIEAEELRDDLLEESLGEIASASLPDAIPPAITDFQPWHMPRKQYVRDVMWAKEICSLANDLKRNHGVENFRYLALTGDDMLDVRHIGERLWDATSDKLYYLGFNTDTTSPEKKARREIREHALKRCEYIDKTSKVEYQDFRNIANSNDRTHKMLREAQSFHAINIDLCNGVAKASRTSPNYFSLIEQVINFQGRSKLPYLLFITTRIDEDCIDQTIAEPLCVELYEAVEKCAVFQDGIRKEWTISSVVDKHSIEAAVEPQDIFVLGFVRWVVKQSVECHMKPKLRSFMSYKVKASRPFDDLLSFSILLTPDYTLESPLSASGPVKPQTSDEKACCYSGDIPKKIRACQNVDALLASNEEVNEECFDRTRELLKECNYDVAKYESWLRERGVHC